MKKLHHIIITYKRSNIGGMIDLEKFWDTINASEYAKADSGPIYIFQGERFWKALKEHYPDHYKELIALSEQDRDVSKMMSTVHQQKPLPREIKELCLLKPVANENIYVFPALLDREQALKEGFLNGIVQHIEDCYPQDRYDHHFHFFVHAKDILSKSSSTKPEQLQHLRQKVIELNDELKERSFDAFVFTHERHDWVYMDIVCAGFKTRFLESTATKIIQRSSYLFARTEVRKLLGQYYLQGFDELELRELSEETQGILGQLNSSSQSHMVNVLCNHFDI